MKKIDNDPYEHKKALDCFAVANSASIEPMSNGRPGYWIEKGDWAIEVIPYATGAHVNGYKTLIGFSTHIESFDELTAAVERLLTAAKEA